MNQYITNNQPNENLTYVLDYLGLSVDEFLKMSDEKIISIYKKSADALNDGTITKSQDNKWVGENNAPIYGKYQKGIREQVYSDSGSKSRYFDIDVWAEKHGLLQFPKASKRERNEGCEGLEEKQMGRNQSSFDGGKILTGSGNERSNTRQNHHPTVKPVHLMSWLVRLVSKEGDTVLDPFAGSFTTGVACKMLGRNFIGIEMDAYYCAIGKARMDAVKTPQPNLFDEKELI